MRSAYRTWDSPLKAAPYYGFRVCRSVATVVKKGESESGGGFLSLFTSGDEDKGEKKQFVLVLSEETHEMTRVEIENMEGELDSSREGAAFLDLLYRNLR